MSTTFYIEGQPERTSEMEVNLSNMNAAQTLRRLNIEPDYSGSIDANELLWLLYGFSTDDDEWHRPRYWQDVLWRLQTLASVAYVLDRKVVWA